VTFAQYVAWQHGAGEAQVDFPGTTLWLDDFRAALRQADLAIDYHLASSQMYLLKENLPANSTWTCRAEFGTDV
jgi:hypothetical protein